MPTDSNSQSLPPQVLVTGDFWHADFADLINGLDVPTMLLPWTKVTQLRECPGSVEMILIGQSQRGSVEQAAVDRLQQVWPGVPVLVLLGSWCEGESRSDSPLKNVTRIYWHQWQGTYQQLRQFLQPTATAVQAAPQPALSAEPNRTAQIAVSALSLAQFEMAQDAFEMLGLTCVWAEKSIWQAEDSDRIAAVCVDCESLTENLTNRLMFLRKQFAELPFFLLMGFPRKQEVQSLKTYWQVSAVISKPIELSSLAAALQQAGIAVNAPPPPLLPRINTGLSPTSVHSNSR